MKTYDVAIIGGGMSGVTAALTFAQLGLHIALIEAVEPDLEISPSFDQRAIALSAASVKIYQTLQLWPILQSIACPISNIHVSDRGHYGFTRLNAKDYQLDALGQVIPLEQAGPILWQQLKSYSNIDTLCPATVEEIKDNQDVIQIKVSKASLDTCQNSDFQLQAKLAIASDGTFSKVVEKAGIGVNRDSYQQHAVIANIVTQEAHQNRAFERFTTSGPLALLPLTQNRLSLVWCQKPQDVDEIMNLNDQAFLQRLQSAFGFRLGKIIRVGERFQYPLSLHLAKQHFKGRLLLLGNSAHTLHPIAGQGFNLGLRDIAALADLLNDALLQGEDIGSQKLLTNYVDLRKHDWQQTITATDALTRLFSHDFIGVQLVRDKVMNLVNLLPLVKNKLAQTAMGYGSKSSRLARGIPLTPPQSVQSKVNDG